MGMDLLNNIKVLPSLPPAARTAAANGTGVDTTGFDAVGIVISAGTITDGTSYVFEVQESSDNSTFTAVADADLIGTEPTLTASDDNVVREVGYKGRQKFVRVAITSVAGVTTGGLFAAYVALGAPRRKPA